MAFEELRDETYNVGEKLGDSHMEKKMVERFLGMGPCTMDVFQAEVKIPEEINKLKMY